jgi:hypothetical protein
MDMFPVYSATPECLRLGTDEVVVLAVAAQHGIELLGPVPDVTSRA